MTTTTTTTTSSWLRLVNTHIRKLMAVPIMFSLFHPPSFSKKKNYQFKETLGVGSYGKVLVR